MARFGLSLALVLLLAIYAQAAPITSLDQIAGTWRGSCTMMGAYPTSDPQNLACVAGGEGGVIRFYEASYNTEGITAWHSWPANSSKGGIDYFFPEDGRTNFPFSFLGNGEFATADQPCFHLDVTGDRYVEYAEYYLANFSGPPGCAPRPADRDLYCTSTLFSYVCHGWRVNTAAPAAPTSSATVLSLAPLSLLLAAILAILSL